MLDEHENVVDIDLYLLNQLHLEDHIFVDGLPFPVAFSTEFREQVEVDTAVVLLLARRQQRVISELVEGSQDVLDTQYRSEKLDELLFRLLANNCLIQRVFLEQLIHQLGVFGKVLSVGLEQHYALRIGVAEEPQRLICGIFEVSEADNVAVRLD